MSIVASLLLTPFAVAVVPPPMSLFSVAFESAINHVCFSNDPGHLIVGLSDNSFRLVTINMNETEAEPNVEGLQIVRYSKICQVNSNIDLLMRKILLILRDRRILNSQMSSFPLTVFRTVI